MSDLEPVEAVPEWLHALHLEQYCASFQRAGLATLHQCRSLSADQLECMGITLPGHRRRILTSLFKTHGIGEPNPPQCVAQTGHVVPGEGNSTHKEEEERDRETLSPSDGRQNPLPRARQVSRVKEEPGDGAQHKPMPRPRRMPPRITQRGNSVAGREQPVPKERTKFSANVCSPATVDASLPPIPQRSTPNCPPVCFTSHLNLTPPNAPSASPDLKRRAPVTRGRVVSQSLILANKTSDEPGTLGLQPPPGPLSRDGGSRDGGRRTLAASSRADPSTDTHAPPLPPKAGVLTNCRPSIPQCISAQPPALR